MFRKEKLSSLLNWDKENNKNIILFFLSYFTFENTYFDKLMSVTKIYLLS